ncbi:MAG: hypothetical protein CBCREVIR_3724 [Candidatus Burkholderia crenata]|nr:putative Bpro protein [Candidatus Burkholderia crenata]CAH2813531.1 MAG: hypothetical protein CBCREVIR_3724 [Candidatus Burkholderia crenata]
MFNLSLLKRLSLNDPLPSRSTRERLDALERGLALEIAQYRPFLSDNPSVGRSFRPADLVKPVILHASAQAWDEDAMEDLVSTEAISDALEKANAKFVPAFKSLGMDERLLSLFSSWVELNVNARLLQQQFELERLADLRAGQLHSSVRPVVPESPVALLSAHDLGQQLGVTDETVRNREAAGEFFSILPHGKKRGRGYPAFQAWPNIVGTPLKRVLDALGSDITGPTAYGFFTAKSDLLGDLSPVECLGGVLTAERKLSDAALALLDGDKSERLAAVLQVVAVYVAELGQ